MDSGKGESLEALDAMTQRVGGLHHTESQCTRSPLAQLVRFGQSGKLSSIGKLSDQHGVQRALGGHPIMCTWIGRCRFHGRDRGSKDIEGQGEGEGQGTGQGEEQGEGQDHKGYQALLVLP